MAQEALGLLECKGLVSLIEGSDAMLKAGIVLFAWPCEYVPSGSSTALSHRSYVGFPIAVGFRLVVS